MPASVRWLPTALLYADGTAMLTSKAYVTPGSTTTVFADTIARINAAIVEVNTYYWLYGYAVSPAIPTLTAPANAQGLFYQSNTNGTGLALQLEDKGMNQGDIHPNSVLDTVLREPNLANIKQARSNLDSGKS